MAVLTGDEIVISKWAALKGTADLTSENEEELKASFPSMFVENALNLKEFCSTEKEREIALSLEPSLIMEAGEKGIYGSLWDLGETAGTGFDVYLRDIPMRQETIEIAELFDLDPYLMDSGGALIICTKRGYALSKALKEAGLPAAVIGTVTDSNDRVVIFNEVRRFLSPGEWKSRGDTSSVTADAVPPSPQGEGDYIQGDRNDG